MGRGGIVRCVCVCVEWGWGSGYNLLLFHSISSGCEAELDHEYTWCVRGCVPINDVRKGKQHLARSRIRITEIPPALIALIVLVYR